MTLKEKFIQDYESKNGHIKCIVVAVANGFGEYDIISTTCKVYDKYRYYCDSTFDDFVMKNNVTCRVVNYMIV